MPRSTRSFAYVGVISNVPAASPEPVVRTISTGAVRPRSEASTIARAEADRVLKTACSEFAVASTRVLPRLLVTRYCASPAPSKTCAKAACTMGSGCKASDEPEESEAEGGTPGVGRSRWPRFCLMMS